MPSQNFLAIFFGGFPEARPVAEEREVVEPWHPETAHPIGSLES